MALENETELLALEELPENPRERLEHLRALVRADKYPYLLCPECGADLSNVDPTKHALYHYPETVPLSRMSQEAREREAVLYRLANQHPPVRY